MTNWFLLTKADCIWCDKAKELLEEKGEGFAALPYNNDQMMLNLVRKAGIKTMPQIWYKDEYIGGYTDLVKFLESKDNA